MSSKFVKKKEITSKTNYLTHDPPSKNHFNQCLNGKNTQSKDFTDDNLHKRILRKKERASKSLHDKEPGSLFANISKAYSKTLNQSSAVIVQNIQNKNYTTNIHNNLNIHINTPTSNKFHSQLKRSILSLGSNVQIKKSTNENYIETMKRLIDSKNFYQIKEELFECKRQNEKLQNEIILLNEKLKTSKSLLGLHEQKSEMIKKQYQEIIDVLNDKARNYITTNENTNTVILPKPEITGKGKCENMNYEVKYSQLVASFTSTFDVILELIELFLIPKPAGTARDSVIKLNNENGSYSIDVYETSYNNDDDRRSTFIEQIQSILLFKLKFLSSVYSMNLDKEISRVHNWTTTFLSKDNLNSANSFSLSNISNTRIKRDTNMFKDNLSISSSDCNQYSPKFYRNISSDSFKDQNEDKIKIFEFGKDDNYSVLNDSSIKELNAVQNDSLNFNEEKSNFNESFNEHQKELNFMNSFGNLVSQSKKCGHVIILDNMEDGGIYDKKNIDNEKDNNNNNSNININLTPQFTPKLSHFKDEPILEDLQIEPLPSNEIPKSPTNNISFTEL